MLDVKYAFVSRLIYVFQPKGQIQRITDIFQFLAVVTALENYEEYHDFTLGLLSLFYLSAYHVVSSTIKQAACPFNPHELDFAQHLLKAIMDGSLAEFVSYFSLAYETIGTKLDAFYLYRSEFQSGVHLAAHVYSGMLSHYLPYQRFTLYDFPQGLIHRFDSKGQSIGHIRDGAALGDYMPAIIPCAERVAQFRLQPTNETILIIKNGYCPELVWGGLMLHP